MLDIFTVRFSSQTVVNIFFSVVVSSTFYEGFTHVSRVRHTPWTTLRMRHNSSIVLSSWVEYRFRSFVFSISVFRVFALLLLDTCDRLLVHLHLRQPVRQALPLAVLLPVLLPLPSALCLPPTVPVSCTNTQLSKPIELHKWAKEQREKEGSTNLTDRAEIYMYGREVKRK